MTTLTSPCIKNCCLNDDDVCLGCFRSIKEILQWAAPDTTNKQKQQILKNSTERKHAQYQSTP